MRGAVLECPALADHLPEFGVQFAEIIFHRELRCGRRRLGFWLRLFLRLVCGLRASLGQFLLCGRHRGPGGGEVIAAHIFARGGGVGVQRQIHRFDLRRETGQHRGHAGVHHACGVGALGITAQMEVRFDLEMIIEYAR